MEIISLTLTDWHQITFTADLAVVAVVAISVVLIRWTISKIEGSAGHAYTIDCVNLGFDGPSVTIRADNRERELAYALWVELGTRKAALPFEEGYDVIVEVYNSWYTFFGTARELMRDIPPKLLKGDNSLVYVTEAMLNKGLRPHLTHWQAAFRRWYAQALELEENKGRTPQEIQGDYPHYEELVADLKRTNNILTRYRDMLADIVKGC